MRSQYRHLLLLEKHSRQSGSLFPHRRAFHTSPLILPQPTHGSLLQPTRSHLFHSTHPNSIRPTSPHLTLRPFILSDPGEGIKEVQIIQWFVRPGARVEQFDKICEVASDKANIEITSRYDGVVRGLRWEQDDVVPVGGVLCDIDVEGGEEGEGGQEEEGVVESGEGEAGGKQQQQKASEDRVMERRGDGEAAEEVKGEGRHAGLATPAVRGLLKEMELDIRDVSGTGRDGRVLKEDIHRHVAERDATVEEKTPPARSEVMSARPTPGSSSSSSSSSSTSSSSLEVDSPQIEEPIALTNIQHQMFKSMTRSLTIPHFLYADELDITALSLLRKRLNNGVRELGAMKTSPPSPPPQKLSYLPFIIKALSLALFDFPLLNARIADQPPTEPPQLILRTNHNIGVAMDTPQGLLVPNIKNVAARSIADIAAELSRLQGLAKEAKLSAKDLTGGTITVSNIGSIGGTYVAPLIVASEVAILGVGRARVVPALVDDDDGSEGGDVRVRRKEVMNFSWSADHRVVDGATMARMAERVRGFVESPERMLTRLR